MALARHARTFIGPGLETARRKAEFVSARHKPWRSPVNPNALHVVDIACGRAIGYLTVQATDA